MSSIVKTEAVILSSVNFRESSKIFTLYTKEFGKVNALFKGARRSKTKFAKSLGPMSHVFVVMYIKEGRGVQIISQCDSEKTFHRIISDLGKICVGLAIVELTKSVTPEHEKNQKLFLLLTSSLLALDESNKNFKYIFYKFELELADCLGYHPKFTHCISCKKPIVICFSANNSVVYRVDKGGPICKNCKAATGKQVRVSFEVLTLLEQLRKTEYKGVFDLNIRKEQELEIQKLLWLYLRYHVPSIVPLKSEVVFSKIFT